MNGASTIGQETLRQMTKWPLFRCR